jgi:ABC-type transport system involved in multi-copper enzyme maturation permease subunit
MRESLKIMSMGQGAYTLSYVLVQGFFSCITSIFIFAAIVIFAAPKDHEGLAADNKPLLGGMLLFGLNLIALAMTLSTLFSDSKLAV